MFEVRSLITNCLHTIQTLTVDQQWLLIAVDTNAPGSGSGMVSYCMYMEEVGYPHNAGSPVGLPALGLSNMTQKKPFSYQAKFNPKPARQMFAFSSPPSTASVVALPPFLLLCLDRDGRLKLHRWVNNPTTQPCVGRYEMVPTVHNLFKVAPSISYICCSYSNGVTRALAFSHKRELYPVYWVVDSAQSTDNVQFITAIPTSSSDKDYQNKFQSIKLPDYIKGICWPDGGDRIYVACSKEYYCLFLDKDSVNVTPLVKAQHFTNTPAYSYLRSATDKVEWSLLALQLDSAIEVHASPLTKSKDSATVCQLETQWSKAPSWIMLHRAMILSCYRDEQAQQTIIECRLAVGSERGGCKKRLVVDADCLDLASSCRSSKESNSMIVMYNRATVYCLERRDPWDLITELLAEKQYASALSICEFMIEDDDLITDRIDAVANEEVSDKTEPDNVLAKIRRIRVLQATDEFRQKKEYASAVRTFLDLNVETTSVLRVICPCLTSGLRQVSDVLGQLAASVDPKAMDEIIVFLTERRARLLGCLKKGNCANDAALVSELQSIDTALIRCYAVFRKPMISILLRLPNYCNCKETAELLRQCGREADLLTMYKHKGRHRDALNILKQQNKHATERLKALVKYFDPILDDELELALDELGKLSFHQNAIEEGVDGHTAESLNSVIDSNHRCEENMSEFDSLCLKLLTNSEHADKLDRIRVVHFLQKFACDVSRMCTAYLETAIYEWHDCSERLHTQLASLYISQAKESTSRQTQDELKQKLASLLEWPQCACDLKVLLPMLQMWPNERASVFARLRQYAQAFSIWIEETHCPQTVVDFVNNIDCSEQAIDCLFSAFLSPKLKVDKPEIYEQTQRIALELLNGPLAMKSNPTTILKILPGDIKLEHICGYLARAMKVSVDHEQDVLFRRNIYESRVNQIEARRRELEQTKFVVDEDSLCFHCKKRLGNAAIARYPDGTVVHLGCDVLLKKENKIR